MGHYEKEWLRKCDGVSLSYYTRYFHIIFSVFNSHDGAKRFFSDLNSRHTKLSFFVSIICTFGSFVFTFVFQTLKLCDNNRFGFAEVLRTSNLGN